MKKVTGWVLFAALVLSTCLALVYFSKKKKKIPEFPPAKPALSTASPWTVVSSPPERELPPTIVPLPMGFGTDQSVHHSDVRGGNAGLLSYDPVWRGGWLGLNLP